MKSTAWEHRLRSATDRATTAAIAGGTLVFGVNPFSPDGQPEAQQSYLRGISTVDGALLWEHEDASGLARPVIARGGLIFVSSSEGLLALESDGRIAWRAHGAITAGPWLADDLIVVARQSELAVYDEEGQLLRKKKHRIKWFDGFCVTQSSWLLTTAVGKVLHLDPSSLEVLQTWVVPGKWAFGCNPVLNGSAAIVNSWAGCVTCFDVESGGVRWRKKKQVGRRGGCVHINGGNVVVSTPRLACLRVSDGKTVWEIDRHIATFAAAGEALAAIAVNDDFSYDLLMVEASGSIRSSVKMGTAHTYGARDLGSLETWIDNGLAFVGDDVVTSHVSGRLILVPS